MIDRSRTPTWRWTPTAALAALCIAVPLGEAVAEDGIRVTPKRAGSSMKAPGAKRSDDPGASGEMKVKPVQPAQPGGVQAVPPGRGRLANPGGQGDGRPGGLTRGPLGGAGQPNLVIELLAPLSNPEGQPGTGMCADAPPSGGPSNQVRFRVRNAGSGEAPASTTVVHWTGPNGFSWMSVVNTQPILPGGGKNTYVNLPPGCWTLPAHGWCKFLVELDRNDDVDETEDDADNNRSGTCLKAGT